VPLSFRLVSDPLPPVLEALSIDAGSNFGVGVGALDVNGNGTPEILVGAWGEGYGAAYVLFISGQSNPPCVDDPDYTDVEGYRCSAWACEESACDCGSASSNWPGIWSTPDQAVLIASCPLSCGTCSPTGTVVAYNKIAAADVGSTTYQFGTTVEVKLGGRKSYACMFCVCWRPTDCSQKNLFSMNA
jgi:hypothetical protein